MIGAGSVIAVLGGLTLDIHGFGAIVLGQTVWLVWVGIALRRES
ncbi:MAG: hypothetical protein O2973_01540 [Gemmatimonadetes bacterium]|nr:hypothetical protein [Gemmatimonadota bacterium]